MKFIFAIFIFVMTILGHANSLPLASPLVLDQLTKCFDNECPIRTVACKKHSIISEDKSHLVISISCLDEQNYELKAFHETAPNPYGANVHFESSSFSGVYHFSTGGNPKKVDVENFT